MSAFRRCAFVAALVMLLVAPHFLAAAAAPPLQVKPIVWRERTLANGLQVISVRQHTSPTVSVQLWYRVGSRDDPVGRSGFAHLFEHMMFKSTRHLANEQFDRLTEDVGGSNNAFTSDDVTAYQTVVPSNHLETILWAEAERMANLTVDAGHFASERSVVEEEYRSRVLASPYGRFFNELPAVAYLRHPYRRPTIGNLDDLRAATIADVVAFHARYYRPDNATLVVAGDFDPRDLDRWVDRYFGAVTRPATPRPRFDGAEPPWPSERTASLTGPRVPLPAVAVAWLAPPVTHRDAPALQVAAAVLSAGESSRLHQSLVYRQQVATQAGFSADLRDGPGLLIGYAIAAGGKPIASVTSALVAEIRRLDPLPPSAAEIDKVKNQLVTAALAARQTPQGLASAIAEAAVIGGDAARVNSDLQALLRVTPAGVRRAWRRWLIGANKVTIEYVQEGATK